MDPSRNNRRDPRVEHEIELELPLPDGSMTYTTHNISYRGVFIKCNDPLPLRTLLRFRIMVQDHDEPLHIVGMVTHCVNQDDAMESGVLAGMGIQLFPVGTEAKSRWRHHVRQQYDSVPDVRQTIRKQEYPHVKLRLSSPDAMLAFSNNEIAQGNTFIRHADLHPQGTRVYLEIGYPTANAWCDIEAIVMEFIETPRQNRGMRLMFPNIEQAQSLIHTFLNNESV